MNTPLTHVGPDPRLEFELTTQQMRWREKAGELPMVKEFDTEFRLAFHSYWTVAGHHIRKQIDDDKTVLKLLRSVLPKYAGPCLVLFRGENLDRWNQQAVGFCWSPNLAVETMFGRGLNSIGSGGVLLKCNAALEAIIAGPGSHSTYLQENEYTLDPTKVSKIELLEQFPSAF